MREQPLASLIRWEKQDIPSPGGEKSCTVSRGIADPKLDTERHKVIMAIVEFCLAGRRLGPMILNLGAAIPPFIGNNCFLGG